MTLSLYRSRWEAGTLPSVCQEKIALFDTLQQLLRGRRAEQPPFPAPISPRQRSQSSCQRETPFLESNTSSLCYFWRQAPPKGSPAQHSQRHQLSSGALSSPHRGWSCSAPALGIVRALCCPRGAGRGAAGLGDGCSVSGNPTFCQGSTWAGRTGLGTLTPPQCPAGLGIPLAHCSLHF